MAKKKAKPEKPARGPAAEGSAEDLYQQEKARRVQRPVEGRDLLAEAKEEFKALLEAEALAGRGGRPKKMVNARAANRAARAPAAPAGDESDDL